jgi:hypothetical protein
MITHKLGLHLNNYSPEALAKARKLQPSVLKVLNTSEAGLTQLRQDHPNAIIICRRYVGNQNWDEEAMYQMIATESQTTKSLIDYWELYNEPLGDAAQLGKFNADVAKRLHDMGLKVCALSLAVGTPEGSDDDIKKELDALWVGVEAADAWSYHAYGAPQVLTSAEWYALRYRRYYRLDPRYLTKPLFLTEGGIDFGVIPGSGGDLSYLPNLGGYRAHNISGQDYATQLVAFNAELMKDSSVKGCTVYEIGNATDWNSFDVTDDCLDYLNLLLTGASLLPTPTPSGPSDPNLDYFGMYGYRPNPDAASYKFGLLPSRNLALKLLAAGDTANANLAMPGPCVSEEYSITEPDGSTSYAVKLTNRIIKVRNEKGVWTPYTVEIFPRQ